ncbi:MAG: sigma-70 family RNA polymerase sigma factor [Candidatus Kariarchaeaceae archaeon]|jgi:RNA polymerase primary sigma factor
MNSSLDNYLREIGAVKLLSPQEEIDLAKRIKQNDYGALQKLVNSNLRFVVSVAKSYQNKGLSLEDLINEGNIGLIIAANRYDETRGFKFISYAVWWIRQSILQAIYEKTRMIRLPLNRVDALKSIGKVYSRLEQDYMREPTSEEIADTLEVASSELSYNIEKGTRCISIDSSIYSDLNNRLLDVIENQNEPKPDSKVIGESLTKEVRIILDTLPHREARILKLYYGLGGEKPHTLEEIGAMFKLTRERIRQIKERALKILRHKSRSSILFQYLE